MKKNNQFESWIGTAGDNAEIQDRIAHKAIAELKGKLRDANRAARLAHKDAMLAEQRLEHLIELASEEHAKPIAKFIPIARARKSVDRGMPVLMLSDYHVEERVDPSTVNGLNEYTPAIAQARLEYLFEGFAWHIEHYAKSWTVTDVCLWLGGDIITGYIHEELLESNWLSPIEASWLAQQLISDGIEYLLKRCPFIERLYVPCSFGNHGRTTPKRRISTGAKNSYEWLMYKTLEQRFSSNPKVQFDVAGGDLLYASIYGKTIRFHHGDDIGFQGGVGGLTIPLRKACDAWNESQHADFTLIGHWHQWVDYGYCVVNGSVIGWSPYCVKIKARYELPRQGVFLVCEQRGKTGSSPVYCDPNRKISNR